ncbi:hypothetical protein L596_027913 [Steinernema carpocapsae]|uniref:Uncharacterized protein n=1 Tax=Steinernema carpocapsae TaxID=34508 RepID=A0A4U5LWZ1_STECR|nr:hypothetical protein L596_027913 [Steinernema carpocapsae]
MERQTLRPAFPARVSKRRFLHRRIRVSVSCRLQRRALRNRIGRPKDLLRVAPRTPLPLRQRLRRRKLRPGEACEPLRRREPVQKQRLSGWCESNLDSFKCQCFTGADCSQRDPACDESQQLRLITIILGITVLLVIVMLLLIVFIVRKRLGNENRRDSHTIKTKESKIYSLPSEYASRYAADPCERRIGTTNSRLREAAEKALREESFYAEIDALSSV